MKYLPDMLTHLKDNYENSLYLVNGSTLTNDIKSAFGSLDDFIFVQDYMGIGRGSPDILSSDFVRTRTHSLSFPSFENYTEDEYEKNVASKLRLLPQKFSNKKHIVLIQWDSYLSEIWRLTMQAYIEQLKLADTVYIVSINTDLITRFFDINIPGSHKLYCDLVCNFEKVDLSKFKISEKAVSCFLDLNSDDGEFNNFIYQKATKYNNPHSAFSAFLEDHHEWGLEDIDFIRLAHTELSKHKEYTALCKNWKKRCLYDVNY